MHPNGFPNYLFPSLSDSKHGEEAAFGLSFSSHFFVLLHRWGPDGERFRCSHIDMTTFEQEETIMSLQSTLILYK